MLRLPLTFFTEDRFSELKWRDYLFYLVTDCLKKKDNCVSFENGTFEKIQVILSVVLLFSSIELNYEVEQSQT